MPLAAFGAIVGTIAGIAAAERRREYYERPYYAPALRMGRRTAITAPQVYQRLYGAVYQHHGYRAAGGYGGHPGFHGPTANGAGDGQHGDAARPGQARRRMQRRVEHRLRGRRPSAAASCRLRRQMLRRKFTC